VQTILIHDLNFRVFDVVYSLRLVHYLNNTYNSEKLYICALLNLGRLDRKMPRKNGQAPSYAHFKVLFEGQAPLYWLSGFFCFALVLGHRRKKLR